MRRTVLVFAVTVTLLIIWRITERLSADAVALVVGLLRGVVGSIVLMLARPGDEPEYYEDEVYDPALYIQAARPAAALPPAPVLRLEEYAERVAVDRERNDRERGLVVPVGTGDDNYPWLYDPQTRSWTEVHG